MSAVDDLREDTIGKLAELIHARRCMHAVGGGRCPRWVRSDGHRHYYELRARVIEDKLEPLIGMAHVIPVTEIVLREAE